MRPALVLPSPWLKVTGRSNMYAWSSVGWGFSTSSNSQSSMTNDCAEASSLAFTPCQREMKEVVWTGSGILKSYVPRNGVLRRGYRLGESNRCFECLLFFNAKIERLGLVAVRELSRKNLQPRRVVHLLRVQAGRLASDKQLQARYSASRPLAGEHVPPALG